MNKIPKLFWGQNDVAVNISHFTLYDRSWMKQKYIQNIFKYYVKLPSGCVLNKGCVMIQVGFILILGSRL